MVLAEEHDVTALAVTMWRECITDLPGGSVRLIILTMVLSAHQLLLAIEADKVVGVIADGAHLHTLTCEDCLVAALADQTLETVR